MLNVYVYRWVFVNVCVSYECMCIQIRAQARMYMYRNKYLWMYVSIMNVCVYKYIFTNAHHMMNVCVYRCVFVDVSVSVMNVCVYKYIFTSAHHVMNVCLYKCIQSACECVNIYIRSQALICYMRAYTNHSHKVTTVSRIDWIIGLFCRIWSLLYGSFAEETYNLIDPTNRSHPISWMYKVAKTHRIP